MATAAYPPAPSAPPPDASAPSVKLKKGFVHDGHQYHAGDTFTGTQQEIDLLVAQGYADKPATPPPAPPPGPPPETQAKLTKAFNHDGHQYNAGDTFTGTQTEIDELRLQGYAAPKQDGSAAATGTGAPPSGNVSASSSGGGNVSYLPPTVPGAPTVDPNAPQPQPQPQGGTIY